MEIAITGFLIFFARIFEVSIGTVRTIVTVQGRTALAFLLGVFEVLIWIMVVSTVVHMISETPILVVFYALGFASGNVVGILVERRLMFGQIILRVITRTAVESMAERIRRMGQAVTVFNGEGMQGPVSELYVVCRGRDLKTILPMVKEEDPSAFYITEQVREVNRILRPVTKPATGWRRRLEDQHDTVSGEIVVPLSLGGLAEQ